MKVLTILLMSSSPVAFVTRLKASSNIRMFCFSASASLSALSVQCIENGFTTWFMKKMFVRGQELNKSGDWLLVLEAYLSVKTHLSYIDSEKKFLQLRFSRLGDCFLGSLLVRIRAWRNQKVARALGHIYNAVYEYRFVALRILRDINLNIVDATSSRINIKT